MHEYLCTDAASVRGQTLQADLNAGSGALIPINAHVVIETIHHDVQITVIIQVSQGHPMAHALIVEAPGRSRFLEVEIALISKCHAWQLQLGIHKDLELQVLAHWTQRLDPRGGIAVLSVEWIAGGHD